MITLELIDSHKWTVAREITERSYSRQQEKKESDKNFNDKLLDSILAFSTFPHDIVTGKDFDLKDNPHWQIRFECGSDDQEHIESLFWHLDPNYYLEKAEVWTDYEKKLPFFWSKDEPYQPIRIRKLPAAKLRPVQKQILQQLKATDDRSILFVVDPKGGSGKTYLVEWLFEHGKAVYLRHTKSDPGRDLASCYAGQPVVCIDVPRSSKLKKNDYEFLEMLKDGLISDERFTNTSMHVRGIQVMVTLNYSPDFKALTSDRYNIWKIKDENGLRILERYEPKASASEVLLSSSADPEVYLSDQSQTTLFF